MRIALTGQKGSGKDTVANYLKKNYGFTKLAFADPIRDAVKNIFQLDTDSEYDKFKRTRCFWEQEHQFDGRHAVREIGMLMRSYDEEQFCKYIQHKIIDDQIEYPVITDLRFDNELKLVRYLGCKVVKIIGKDQHIDLHITERGFSDDQCDYVIDNREFEITLLENKVDLMMKELYNVQTSSEHK